MVEATSRFREDARGMAQSMLEHGSCAADVGNFVKFCRRVEGRLRGGHDYREDVARAVGSYVLDRKAAGIGKSRSRTLDLWQRRIVCYVEHGAIDFSRPKAVERPPVGGEFDAQLALYAKDLSRRGLAQSTQVKYYAGSYRFLVFLRGLGLDGLGRVSAREIDEYVKLLSSRHSVNGVANELVTLRSILGFADSRGITENARHAVPHGKYVRPAPVPPLSDRDIAAIVAAIDNSTVKGKRDLAMVLLAARLGMRSSEITSLELGDIDWEKRTLLVRQSKTPRNLLLPADDTVMAALADYILNARPDSGSSVVFLTVCAPFSPFSQGCKLWLISKPYYDKAGVLVGKRGTAAQAGLHRMRHSAATKMLAAGARPESVASALGHKKVDTTMIYASVDAGILKSCCLSLPEGGRGL